MLFISNIYADVFYKNIIYKNIKSQNRFNLKTI